MMKECPGIDDNCCKPILDSEDYCEECEKKKENALREVYNDMPVL